MKMKKMIVVPEGWSCEFGECRPGFFVFEENLFLKTEYGDNEAYCCLGEYFWGGVSKKEDLVKLEVQPVCTEWIEEE